MNEANVPANIGNILMFLLKNEAIEFIGDITRHTERAVKRASSRADAETRKCEEIACEYLEYNGAPGKATREMFDTQRKRRDLFLVRLNELREFCNECENLQDHIRKTDNWPPN